MGTLAEEILSMPRGTLARIIERVTVGKRIVYKCVIHGRGSEDTAQQIAAAVGCPERWPELLARLHGLKPQSTKRAKAPEPRKGTRKQAPRTRLRG